ncbi:MAG: hypothetical protein ACOC0P_07730 [Planctomycetota bacterium]
MFFAGVDGTSNGMSRTNIVPQTMSTEGTAYAKNTAAMSLLNPQASEESSSPGRPSSSQAMQLAVHWKQDGNAGEQRDARERRWPFSPTATRVHPLSRWLPPNERRPALLEARIEFFDAFTHNVKGMGRVRFELLDTGGESVDDNAGALAAARRIGIWEIDLADVDRNVQHYDAITRTYSFRLQPDPGVRLPERAVLSVQVQWEDRRMTDNRMIRLR